MELIIGTINLGECVISAKRTPIDSGRIQKRTLGGSLVSQYMFDKFSYEFEVDITIAQTNLLYDLATNPFQTVIYGKKGWNTYNTGVTCYIEVIEEDDGDLWRNQPLDIDDRYQTVKIKCEEQ